MKLLAHLILVASIVVCSCTENTANYSFSTQSLVMQSVSNARELGGYILPDGRAVIHGLLLRGGALDKLSSEDSTRFAEEYHLARIYDLRSEHEAEYAADINVGDALYVHLPAYNFKQFAPGSNKVVHGMKALLEEYAFDPSFQAVCKSTYQSLAFDEVSLEKYRFFLRDIIGCTDGAIYFHCTHGKDRTGWASALLLSALGADKKIIVNDFSISNEVYASAIEETWDSIEKMGGGEAERELVYSMVGVSVANFTAALDSIDRRYGSMDNYLTECLGLSEDDRTILKERYLKPTR